MPSGRTAAMCRPWRRSWPSFARRRRPDRRPQASRSCGRVARAPESPRSGGGRPPAGRPGRAGPRLARATRRSTSRSRSRSRTARRPARLLDPADLPSELGPLVEEAHDPPVERVDPTAQAAQLGRLVDGLAHRPSVAIGRPPGDRLEGQRVARGALADDRLEGDVGQEVDLPERLAGGRIRQVDLDERPLDRRAARRAG